MVGDRAYTWEDVVLAGYLWSEWPAVERQVRAGLACLARLDDLGEAEAGLDDEIDAAAAEFRYARDLVAADEMEAWLAERGLTADEWLDHVRRSILLRRWAAEAEAIEQEYELDQEDVDQALVCEAICTGRATLMTSRLSERVALYARVVADSGDGQDGVTEEEVDALLASVPVPCGNGMLAALSSDACRERLKALARMETVWRRFASTEASPQAIRDLITTRWLDWIRLRVRRVFLPDADMAREVALCVREDHRTLCDVAAEAGANLDEGERYVDEVDETLRDQLVGAQCGDLLGPLPVADGFVLVEVVAKQPPSEADPDVRARAERALLSRTVDREVESRVTWHRPL